MGDPFAITIKTNDARCGIYGIYCIELDQWYIGLTSHFGKRASKHMSDLRSNRHYCTALQNAWNKYTSNAFTFFWLLTVPKDKLVEAESDVCTSFAREKLFNTRRAGGIGMQGRKHKRETRAKLGTQIVLLDGTTFVSYAEFASFCERSKAWVRNMISRGHTSDEMLASAKAGRYKLQWTHGYGRRRDA